MTTNFNHKSYPRQEPALSQSVDCNTCGELIQRPTTNNLSNQNDWNMFKCPSCLEAAQQPLQVSVQLQVQPQLQIQVQPQLQIQVRPVAPSPAPHSEYNQVSMFDRWMCPV